MSSWIFEVICVIIVLISSTFRRLMDPFFIENIAKIIQDYRRQVPKVFLVTSSEFYWRAILSKNLVYFVTYL